MKKIHKLLVANRGEIAVRIFRTLREMGISSVAIYSAPDTRSVHAGMADQSLRLAGKGLAETYLNGPQIIELALGAGVDAIHPGYGFLSESDGFSRAVREAGLVFIGPGDEAIRLMGNKAEARRLAGEIGIPVIEGAVGRPEDLSSKAVQMGFPVLVKAAGGGGGKGMRIVYAENEIDETLEATRREALNYFGTDEVYIEKYLANPRHIEVQILADQHGKVLSLFERDCSIQRRYQKIIEEAPAPGISNSLREKLMEAARAISSHISYANAGTVEFLVKDDDFFFLEMNTRIQVEHAVTEMITGVDLVREQINIAMGKPLLLEQEDLSANGYAIEARVYAEDPARNFIPSPGRIIYYREPGNNGLRIDTAMETGSVIPMDFDPMISKMISHGATREEAIQKLRNGLQNYSVHGIQTNLAFLDGLLGSDAFARGETDTGLCDRLVESGLGHQPPTEEYDELMIAAFLFASRENGAGKQAVWNRLGYWRLLMSPELLISDRVVKRNLFFKNPERFQMELAGQLTDYHLLKKCRQEMSIEVAGVVHQLRYTCAPDDSVWIQKGSCTCLVRYAQKIDDRELIGLSHSPVSAENSVVKAPMHGKVVKVNVKPADIVNKGDTLLILESMKMENRIVATARGKVESISVEAGVLVSDNTPLVYLSSIT
jgi:3-methylcrotonyl-CoA carboxylase alpha subunit